MFQRFHEIKANQENDAMHSTGGESRSSTPGIALDGRAMFSTHASPLPSQHASITSYPSVSSPAVMTASPATYYGTKYVSSTPPEAHRYSSDSFRASSELTEQERYIVDPYRQLHGDGISRTIHSDFQRIRVDDQMTDTYHRPVGDIYSGPVDLQRVPESNSQQLITAQRLVSELQRMQAEGLRSVSSEPSSLRHDLPTDSISVTESTNYRGSLPDSDRVSSESSYRVTQETTLRTHSDPQRLVQESFKDFFPPPQSPKPSMDILRLAVEQRTSSNRYMVSDGVRSDPQNFSSNLTIQRNIESETLRANVTNSQEILSEDLRTGANTPQSGLPEHLRIEPNGILSDNLRAGTSASQSLSAENLRLIHEPSHSMISDNRHRSSHSMIIDNHRIDNNERHILMPENLRIPSSLSQNIDTMRGDPDVVSHGVLSDNVIVTVDGTHNLVPDNLRVGSDTSRNLIVENLRHNESETSHSLTPENLIRVATETSHAMSQENLRLVSNASHSLIQNHLRFGSETSRNSLSDNLRLVTDNHHVVLPENLRVSSEASRMVPENLCLAEPAHQALPEDLHINHNTMNEGSISNSIDHQNGRILAHDQATESSLSIMRSHYDASSHRIMIENPHVIRVQSPHYSDVYRNDLQDNLNSVNSATPGPPIQMGDLSGTQQYYSSSYSSIHNNHYGSYINDECDDRDGMSLEEKINRGYHDIKPFDQNYPVPMTLMHMPQETIQPLQSATKPPKPKKPKEPKPPRLPVVHKCIECLRVFKNSTQLKNHMWRHTGEKPFTCDQCGSKFTQQGNLRAHRRIHTGERPYECQECKSSFTQLSTLKTHQKIHSDERPYHCSECDAAFRQIANLKTHQVTHTGERPHKCDLCDKAFTQKSNLKAHKNRVHIGDGNSAPAKRGRKKNPVAIKPYNCPDCGAKFTMISNLKIHSKLHAGNRPYECEYCGAEFAQRSNMKTHVQRMHGKIPGVGRRRIRCDECPAMFRLRRCLKTHKKRRHPIKSLKIKILRESKYLMNSASPTSGIQEDDDMDDDGDEDDDECDDDEDDDTDEEEESDEEILESQLLTKKPRDDENVFDTRRREEVNSDFREPIIDIKEPKLEPMDDSHSRSVMEVGRGAAVISDLQAKRNNSESDDNSTSSKENDGSVKQRWEGRFNIKEEIEQSPANETGDLPLLSSNTS